MWNCTFFPKRFICMDLLFAYGIPFARVFCQVHFPCFCDLYNHIEAVVVYYPYNCRLENSLMHCWRGWSETTATNALVQDEAVQAILGMNKKHILLPCPGIFQPPSLPQNFPLLPTSPPPTYLRPPTSLTKLQSCIPKEFTPSRILYVLVGVRKVSPSIITCLVCVAGARTQTLFNTAGVLLSLR